MLHAMNFLNIPFLPPLFLAPLHHPPHSLCYPLHYSHPKQIKTNDTLNIQMELQIMVCHWTMAGKNLPMCDEIPQYRC